MNRYVVKLTAAGIMAGSGGALTGTGAMEENVAAIICGCVAAAVGMNALFHTELTRREEERFALKAQVIEDAANKREGGV